MDDLIPTMLISLFLGAVVGLGIGYMVKDSQWKDATVARGCAQYFLNERNTTEWKWTPCK